MKVGKDYLKFSLPKGNSVLTINPELGKGTYEIALSTGKVYRFRVISPRELEDQKENEDQKKDENPKPKEKGIIQIFSLIKLYP